MKLESCLVTGGAGFIGCATSSLLAETFTDVCCLDNLHPQIHKNRTRPEALDSRVPLVIGDISSADVWDSLLNAFQPQVIIHLASETGTGQSLMEAVRHSHTNVCGTTTMLDALVRHSATPTRIVLTSSRAVYGEGAWIRDAVPFYPGQRKREQLLEKRWDFPDAVPMAASAGVTVPNPVSIYGASKVAQEMVLSAWAQSFGTEIVILRLQNVYGPGQSLTNPYTGIVPLFCRMARQGLSIPLYEDGAMRRDFVFITDVVEAINRAITLDSNSEMLFDIGTGLPTTIAELAGLIAGYYNAPAPHVSGEFRYGDVRHAFCNTEPSATKLGWMAKHTLSKGLSKLCPWLEEEVKSSEF